MISFRKYHCFGRDFILLDNRDGAFRALQSAETARLCAQRFGIGASGILRLDGVSKNVIHVKSFNVNGNLAELNLMDAASVAVFAKDLGLVENAIHVEINEQTVCCNPVSNHENMYFVNVRMTEPLLVRKVFQTFVMDYGTQFCMVPTDEVNSVDVVGRGREISYGKRFLNGANVTFYQPHPGFLEVRHYEHQTDRETYANGLCILGAALSHAHNNPMDQCLVRTKGGETRVSFSREEESFYNVEIQILVNAVYHGTTF